MLLDHGEVHQTYSPQKKVPITFLIDKDGKVREVYDGFQTKSDFVSDIEKYLDAKLSKE